MTLFHVPLHAEGAVLLQQVMGILLYAQEAVPLQEVVGPPRP